MTESTGKHHVQERTCHIQSTVSYTRRVLSTEEARVIPLETEEHEERNGNNLCVHENKIYYG